LVFLSSAAGALCRPGTAGAGNPKSASGFASSVSRRLSTCRFAGIVKEM
jgi:hypothetical protein